MRRFECRDGASSKFWEIALSGKSFTIRFGKIGTDGQSQVKSFPNDGAAKKEHDKLVAEKTKKGYVEQSASTASTTSTPIKIKASSQQGSALERLDAWLRKHRAAYYRTLEPGASREAIGEFEARLGERLPETLAALFAWKGGGNERFQENYRLMTLADADDAHRALTELQASGEFDPPSHWGAQWIPFLDNGGGDHVCVDLGGAFGGAPGQVLEFWHADGDRNVTYPSLDAWLEVFVTTLEQGAWKRDASGFFEGDEKLVAAARAAIAPGYPQKHDRSEGAPTPGATKAEKAKGKARGKATANEKAPAASSPNVHPRALRAADARAPRETTLLTALPPNVRDTPVVSADGARFAYRVGEGSGEPTRIVCDGVDGPELPYVGVPSLGPDGRLVHACRDARKKFTVHVGTETFGPFDGVGNVAFSPDATRFAFRGDQGKKAHLIEDGVASEPHDALSDLLFTADGRLLHAVFDGGVARVFLGKAPIGEHPGATLVHHLCVSPDGAHVAYALKTPEGHRIALDGEIVESKIQQPQRVGFSPKGELYYAASDVFVFGGKRTSEDDWIEELVFTADGALHARIDNAGNVIGAKKKKLAAVPGLFRAVFHETTRAFAFEVIEGDAFRGERFVVVGGARLGPFQRVSQLGFADGGDEVHFASRKGDELWWNVVPIGAATRSSR